MVDAYANACHRLCQSLILALSFMVWPWYLSPLSLTTANLLSSEMELGLGYRVRQEDYLSFVKSEFFTTLIYTWNQWVIKMSILALYWRVFVTQKPRKILKWLIGWLCIYGLVNCIAPIFSCIPVQKFWNPSLDGHCMQGGELH